MVVEPAPAPGPVAEFVAFVAAAVFSFFVFELGPAAELVVHKVARVLRVAAVAVFVAALAAALAVGGPAAGQGGAQGAAPAVQH